MLNPWFVCSIFSYLLHGSVTAAAAAAADAMAAMQAKRMQAQRTAQRLNTRKEERAKALHER